MTSPFQACLVASCAAVALIGAALVEQSQPSAKPTGDPATQEQRAAEPVPPPLQRGETTAKDKQSTGSEPDQERHDFHDIAIAASAIVQAASAVIVAGLTAALIYYSRRTVNEAKRSADAAHEALGKMQANAESQSRDMGKSIEQAGRAADEMNRIAKAMAANVEFVEKSLTFSKQIVDNSRMSAEAAHEQASAALVAAQAAERSASAAEFALKAVERAYVDVVDFSISNLSTGARPRVTFDVRNTGRTPARALRVSGYSHYADVVPERPDGMTTNVEGKLLVAGGKIGVNIDLIPIGSDHELAVIRAGGLWLFVEVAYSDASGSPHTYRICVEFGASLQRLVLRPSHGWDYAD